MLKAKYNFRQALLALVGLAFFLGLAQAAPVWVETNENGFAIDERTPSHTGPSRAWIETNDNGFAVYERLDRASTNGLGVWIWAGKTLDKQTCRLWRSFDIPRLEVVKRAKLSISADNGYRVWLDGRQVGQGSDWHDLSFYDVTQLLQPGRHVLAVEGFNDANKAGVIVGLRMELASGRVLRVASDRSWRVVPNDLDDWEKRTRAEADWPPATITGILGKAPWWSIPTTIVNVPPLAVIPTPFWQNGWFQVALLGLGGVVFVLWFRLAAQLAIQSKAQQLLQLERARIARDLHDDLGARITQLLLTGEEARARAPAGSVLNAEFGQICESARDALYGVDEVVWLVNSQRDTLNDFVIYICKYAQSFLRSTPIRCRFDVQPDLPAMTFDLPIRRSLLLAVKEALSNVARHSEAAELFLRIRILEPAIQVVVEDNGRGFDPAHTDDQRNGLTNMAKRMQELGGDCLVSSRPGEGARIEFNIPLACVRHRSRWFRRRFRTAGREPKIPGKTVLNATGARSLT